MEARKLILSEIEAIPEIYLREVLDFIYFVKGKILRQNVETAILSESALGKDWLKPEEDEAWQNL